MDRSSKQNINKDIVALNNALDQTDLNNIYRTFHPKEAKYTFFSNAHGTVSKIDHRTIFGHKDKPQQIQENWNHIKHFLRPQGLETRKKYQEKSSKKLKFMEIE